MMVLCMGFTRRDEGLVLIKPEESGKARLRCWGCQGVAMCLPTKMVETPIEMAFCVNFMRESDGNRILGLLLSDKFLFPMVGHQHDSTRGSGSKDSNSGCSGII